MQPGKPMFGGGSVFLAQAATTPRSDSSGSQWHGDYCKMLISSSERGHGSGDEGEGFLLLPSHSHYLLPVGGGKYVGCLPLLPSQLPHQHAKPTVMGRVLVSFVSSKLWPRQLWQRSKEEHWPGHTRPFWGRRSGWKLRFPSAKPSGTDRPVGELHQK